MPYDERNGLAMLYAIAAALVLVLDQGLKYFVTLKIALNEGVMQLIPGVMSLVNLHNTGMAFGFCPGALTAGALWPSRYCLPWAWPTRWRWVR